MFLRAGTYYLTNTLALTDADSGLTIQAYNGEAVEVSGAQPIVDVMWEPYNITNGSRPVMSLLANTNLVQDCQEGKNSTGCRYRWVEM